MSKNLNSSGRRRSRNSSDNVSDDTSRRRVSDETSRRQVSDVTSRRVVRFAVSDDVGEVQSLGPSVGVAILRAILHHPLNKLTLLQLKNRPQLMKLVRSMSSVMVRSPVKA